MLLSSLRRIRASGDLILAVLNTGISSSFWLLLAFVMPISIYGRIMSLQAGVLLVGLILTFRTHDLVFYLQGQGRYSLVQAFRVTLRIEWLSAALGIALVAVGASFMFHPARDAMTLIGVVGFACLAAISASQGAAIAILRHEGRGDLVVKADWASVLGWGVTMATIPFANRLEPTVILLASGIPGAARTIVLVIGAKRTVRTLAPAMEENEAQSTGENWTQLGRYLIGGQVANFLKNGAIPIETMILTVFFSPAVVGLYRIARGALALAVAANNVIYQKTFPILARTTSGIERRKVASMLARNSALVQFSFYPLTAIILAAYAFLKPDVTMWQLQGIAIAIFVSQLPVAVQQGDFAILSLAGRHTAVSLAYAIAFAVLGVLAVLLTQWPILEIFLVGLTLSGIARMVWLRMESQRVLRTSPCLTCSA